MILIFGTNAVFLRTKVARMSDRGALCLDG